MQLNQSSVINLKFNKLDVCTNLLSLILFLLLCSSCNLRPVYSNFYNAQILNQLNIIEIEPVQSIHGAQFCYHLSTLLPKSTTIKAKYLLKVSFTSVTFPAIIQKNSDLLRETVVQTVSYKLIDIISNRVLTSGQFKNVTSYDTASLPYRDYMNRETSLEHLVKQAADMLQSRLILYFEQNKNKQ